MTMSVRISKQDSISCDNGEGQASGFEMTPFMTFLKIVFPDWLFFFKSNMSPKFIMGTRGVKGTMKNFTFQPTFQTS